MLHTQREPEEAPVEKDGDPKDVERNTEQSQRVARRMLHRPAPLSPLPLVLKD